MYSWKIQARCIAKYYTIALFIKYSPYFSSVNLKKKNAFFQQHVQYYRHCYSKATNIALQTNVIRV